MTTGEAVRKMILFYEGNQHDICHFLKVYAYAKTIGELEGLDVETQKTLELTAVVHDIACPLCRRKYGEARGDYQERESEPLLRAFFDGCDLPEKMLERIIYIVTHHHTYVNVEGLDYQIMLEADFLVNADEGGASRRSIEKMLHRVFRTETGKQLLTEMYLN